MATLHLNKIFFNLTFSFIKSFFSEKIKQILSCLAQCKNTITIFSHVLNMYCSLTKAVLSGLIRLKTPIELFLVLVTEKRKQFKYNELENLC